MYHEFSRIITHVLALSTLTLTLIACSGSNIGNNGYASGTMPFGGNGSTGNGPSCLAEGTLTVANQGSSAYLINGAPNPTLTLCRDATYVFSVNASGHPFYIKTSQTTGTANTYNDGVDLNGSDVGTVTFAIPAAAPDILYYDSSIDAAMTGVIHIVG